MLLPALVFGPMAGGLVVYLAGRRSKPLRDHLVRGVTALVFALAALLLAGVAAGGAPALALPGFAGLGLSFMADGFRAIYACLAAFMWLGTTLASKEYFARYRNRNRYYFFLLLTQGAAMGVFLSADLFTTFLFFELMGLASYAMVAHDEQPQTLEAAGTYLAVAVLGGMVMLMGLFLLWHHAGTLEIAALHAACQGVPLATRYLIGGLLLVGFGAKAGMFPLHIWLPKAHPVAPAPASALLSGVLTKSGIFGVVLVGGEILRGEFAWGMLILLLGAVTMLMGAVLAVFSVNLKGTLACSSVSQIGFILVGCGMQCLLGSHNALAVWGTLLHMVNHSLTKLVLFLVAGVVYQNLHKLQLDDIRGFGRGKPLLAAVFLPAALSLAGVPLFSGYLSKTLLHESMVELLWAQTAYAPWVRLVQGVEVAFLLAGGLTAAYMTKLFVVLFVEKPSPQVKAAAAGPYLSPATGAVLGMSALLFPLLGSFPRLPERIAAFGQGFFHGHLPDHALHYFSWANLRGAVASLLMGAVLYLLVVRGVLGKREGGALCYPARWPPWLDLENSLYRPLLWALSRGGALLARLADRLVDGPLLGALGAAGAWLARLADRLVDGPLLGAAEVGGTLLARVADTLPDGVVRLVMARFLRPNKAKPFPGRFLGRFHAMLFPPERPGRQPSGLTESFSFSLLLFGLGITVMLLVALAAALGHLPG